MMNILWATLLFLDLCLAGFILYLGIEGELVAKAITVSVLVIGVGGIFPAIKLCGKGCDSKTESHAISKCSDPSE